MLRARTFLVLLGLLVSGTASAETKKVSLGEVSVVPRADGTVAPFLRTTAESELGALDLTHVRRDAVLSVSLVRLDTEQQANGTSVTCVVSATLRTKTGGTIFAILEGRARVDSSSDAAKRQSLQSAVHGAMTRIPEALKRAHAGSTVAPSWRSASRNAAGDSGDRNTRAGPRRSTPDVTSVA